MLSEEILIFFNLRSTNNQNAKETLKRKLFLNIDLDTFIKKQELL